MLRRDRLIRKHIRTRYLITLTSEDAFEGVLVDADAVHLVLEGAATFTPSGDRVPVDGRLWIPRATVKYMLTTGT